jgi:hypothetical protein
MRYGRWPAIHSVGKEKRSGIASINWNHANRLSGKQVGHLKAILPNCSVYFANQEAM